MSRNSVRTVLRMRAREGCEQAFTEAWHRSAQEIGQVPGSVRQDLLVDADDPRSYLIVAEWTDRAALDAFSRSEYRDRLTAALRDLRESAERSTYRVLMSVGAASVPCQPPTGLVTPSHRAKGTVE
jgi:quinol monooxygenase YgiN